MTEHTWNYPISEVWLNMIVATAGDPILNPKYHEDFCLPLTFNQAVPCRLTAYVEVRDDKPIFVMILRDPLGTPLWAGEFHGNTI